MTEPRLLTDDEVAAILPRYVGLQRAHVPCEECGLLPLYFEADYREIVRVDACLGFLTHVVNACCGHGGREVPYVRISRAASEDSVDICGGLVMPYRRYRLEPQK